MSRIDQEIMQAKYEKLLEAEVPGLKDGLYLSYAHQAIYEHIERLKAKLAEANKQLSQDTYGGKYAGEV